MAGGDAIMTICMRLQLGWLLTDDGIFAILRKFGSGFIASRKPEMVNPAIAIFDKPEIVKPKGDYGIIILEEPKLIKFLSPHNNLIRV